MRKEVWRRRSFFCRGGESRVSLLSVVVVGREKRGRVLRSFYSLIAWGTRKVHHHLVIYSGNAIDYLFIRNVYHDYNCASAGALEGDFSNPNYKERPQKVEGS